MLSISAERIQNEEGKEKRISPYRMFVGLP